MNTEKRIEFIREIITVFEKQLTAYQEEMKNNARESDVYATAKEYSRLLEIKLEYLYKEMFLLHNEDIPYDVMTTDEMTALYSVESFLAPFCFVKRRSDGQKGTLQFTHMPRYYFGFQHA